MSPADARKSRAVHYLPLTPRNHSLHSCGASCPAFTPDLARAPLQQEPCYTLDHKAGCLQRSHFFRREVTSVSLCGKSGGALRVKQHFQQRFLVVKAVQLKQGRQKGKREGLGLVYLFVAVHFQGSFPQSLDFIRRTSTRFQQIVQGESYGK